jgi:hypothetical protein
MGRKKPGGSPPKLDRMEYKRVKRPHVVPRG